jgi:dTDP-alpha-D-glucose dehydrogenase
LKKPKTTAFDGESLMPAVLNLKPEDLDTIEKRAKFTVTVVGCGRKGILYANGFAGAGFKVVCTDSDPILVKKLSKGKTQLGDPEVEAQLKKFISTEQLSVAGDLKKAVSQGDIVILAIAAKIDETKKPDYSELANVCKQIGASLHAGVLVVYGSIAGLGLVEGVIKETLENTSGLKAGVDFGLFYSPIFSSSARPVKSTANLELKVAGTENSLEAAITILKLIAKNVKPVADVKTVEIATLFSVAKQDADTALANELAVFCEGAKADYFEITKLLDTNNAFYPQVVGEENKEAYLLFESAENLNVKLRIPTLARQINEDMVKHAVNLTQDALRSCNKTLRRARVAVLGSANPKALTDALVKMLELKGAKINVFDPSVKGDSLDSGYLKTSVNEAVDGADCIVLLAGQERLNLKKLKPLTKNPCVVVDLTGAFDPQNVKTEGFIYRGLGRGTG